jgi:hypothetical protein
MDRGRVGWKGPVPKIGQNHDFLSNPAGGSYSACTVLSYSRNPKETVPGIPPGIVAAISRDTEFSQKLEFFGIRNHLSDLLFQNPELASHSPKVQLCSNLNSGRD